MTEWEQKKAGLLEYLENMALMQKKCNQHNRQKGYDAPSDEERYTSLPEFWLKEGKVFDSTPFTADEEEQIWKFLEGGLYRIKECFQNAQSLLMTAPDFPKDDDFQYAEGMGFGRAIIPVDHAWVTLNNKPIDVTWTSDAERMKKASRSKKRVMERVRENQREGIYLGLNIPIKYVRKHLLRVNRYSLVVEGKYDYPWLQAGGVPWRKREKVS